MGIEDITSGLGARFGTAANGLGIGFGKGGLSISANFNSRLEQKLSQTPQNSPLKKLYTKQAGYDVNGQIVFPLDIDTDHYIMIKQIQRVQDKRSSSALIDTKKTIVLPIPANLNPQYSVAYRDQEMGIAGGMAAGIAGSGDFYNGVASAIGQGGDAISSLGKFLGGSASKNDAQRTKDLLGSASLSLGATALGATLSNLGGGGAAVGAFLGAAVGGADKVVQGTMSRNNVALNSHMAVLFDNVGFRTFTFQYKFIARNQKESNELQRLISTFKYAMYPSLPETNRYMFTYPDEFKLEFSEKINASLFKFKRSVLTDMSVNYNGDGVPRFFDETGAPVVVDVTLQFKEVEIMTKEDFAYSDEALISDRQEPTPAP